MVIVVAVALPANAEAIAVALIGASSDRAVCTTPAVIANTCAVVALAVGVTAVEAVSCLAARPDPETVAMTETRRCVTLAVA